MSAQIRTERVLSHISPAATSSSGAAPVNVVVTGACGNIAYAIMFMIAQGQMLGNQRINLRLLDIPPMAENLKGVAMEITDCAFPLINEITSTTDYAVAFHEADICMLIGARPRGPGMDRADLLKANASIFAGQGKAINDYAKKTVKCLVVGNPANTNAYIAMMNAPSIPQTAFNAMTRLDHNRAVGQIADKLSVSAESVKNISIWGNHSSAMHPDLSSALVVNWPARGQVTPALAALNDQEWVSKTFINTVALRGGAIIKARGKSSAASAAKAAVDHIHDWVLGTRKGEWVAMAVPSDGSYGVPKGLMFSFPCVAANGHYKIVQGVRVNAEAQKAIEANIKELSDEKSAAGY